MRPPSHSRPVLAALRGARGRVRLAPALAGTVLGLLLFQGAGIAHALGPHEILLIANRNAAESREIARYYADLRRIPDCNVIELALPEKPPLEITADEFNRLIREPAERLIHDRGIADHIVAWVYSTHFPTTITAKPALSIQGITFLRGRLPDAELVEGGTYANPLFAGPDSPTAPGFPPQSFDVHRAWLGPDMPLPSMMLGYIGPSNGNTCAEIKACLQAGVQSDGTRPAGPVCFSTNTNIRTLCRSWEFRIARAELNALGITTLITPDYPSAKTPLMGLMAGSADIPEATPGRLTFLPGAIAEHLTSFGAIFNKRAQTKISAWIRTGATASSGTITEPRAIWTKFPHARIFTYPVAGCTIMESFFQAIRCPLQILIIGEPLAAPWAPRSKVTLTGLPTGPVTQTTPLHIAVEPHNAETFGRFMVLLDGRLLNPPGTGTDVTLDPAGLASGKHTLRVIAYQTGSVRSQVFTELAFEKP